MSSSIPKVLLKSAEFRPLGELGRIVVRGVWKRGAEQVWDGRDELLTDLQSQGMFLGARGGTEFNAFVEECVGTGALVEEGGALTMPIFSADHAKGERTAVASRKDRQRELDELFPERVEERAARKSGRHGDAPAAPPGSVTTGVTGADVTRDGHVPGDVTVAPLALGGVGEEDESNSSSSTADSGRAGARGAAPTGDAPVTPPVTGGVTPPVTLSGTPDVTPPVAPVTPPAVATPARGPARILLEDSRGAITGANGRSWVDAFDAELVDQVPDLTPERLVATARFVSDKKRLAAAFSNYSAATAAEIALSGRVTLQFLRGRKDEASGKHGFAPLVDLARRAEDWAAAEAAKVTRGPAVGARASPDAPAPPRPTGSPMAGLAFGPKRASPQAQPATAVGEKKPP